MPRFWYSGATDMGPSPNQPVAPSDMDTGEIATWPTTVPSTLATSDTVSCPALRSASTMNGSVWLVCGARRNAEVVTAWIAATSAAVSSAISIFTGRDEATHGFSATTLPFFQK